MTLSSESVTFEFESVSSAFFTSIGPSGMDFLGNVGGGSRFQIPLDSKLSFRTENAFDTGSRGSI